MILGNYARNPDKLVKLLLVQPRQDFGYSHITHRQHHEALFSECFHPFSKVKPLEG